MNFLNKITLAITLAMLFSFVASSQTLDFRKTNIFPNDGPVPYDTTGFSYTDSYVPSNSFWAAQFSEEYVYHSRLKYTHPTNPDMSYELRVGKGGHIYSFLTSAGETVPPQYPPEAPWVDEVWQMVAVDGSLNDPPANKKYFIHQAGVYLKTPEQTLPFYSPIIAEYYDSTDNSYTIVNWGQQAHTADNQISGHTSAVLYYTRFKNLGNGVIQVDMLMYNFGSDNMNFINIPWGGVRRSTYDHWFSSNPNHTYQEETGVYTSYHESLPNTGGWAAWSSVAGGHAPTLALLMDNNSGVLRMGDAGSIASRDYTVFEGIQFPGTNLGSGKAIRGRNYYILDSDIDSIQSRIVADSLGDKTFYGSHNFNATNVDSTAYSLELQGDDLTITEVNYADGLQLKLRPYLNSKPLFVIKSTDGEYRITTDLYTYSENPYDGIIDTIQLLGFRDNATKVELKSAIVCAGESYTFPDGTVSTNINSTVYHVSHAGMAYNGYDSLIFTAVYTTPNSILTTNSINDGPGGVGSTNGGSSLLLWLDANQLSGNTIPNPTNGTAIGEWIDLSGNNDNYKSTSPNQPTFSSSGAFNAVNFNAAATNPQFLTGSNSDNQPYGTVFMALKATDAGNNNPLLSNANFSLKYEQNNNSGFLGYSEIGGTNYTSTLASTFGVDNIISFQTSCTTNMLDIYSGNNSTSLNIGATTNGIPLGNLGTTTERISGDFYEIIAFQTNLNSAQKILVDNYLSAKYGNISIANDLYDEDNTANGDFDHDVAGIGRIDANNIHDNAKGTGVLRIKNPTNLDDGEFLIWGDNGQALTFTDTFGLPSYILSKTPKIWRLSEVNTALAANDVGAVDMTFDLSGVSIGKLASVVLLIDTDDDGSFADETFITSSSFDNIDYEGQADVHFNGLNLQDGQRFCLAYLAPDGPGGVYSNLALWLAADGEKTLSGNHVGNWFDKSENEKTATGALGPVFSTSSNKLLNYNPVMTMDGVNDNFSTTSIAGLGTHSDLNIFIVTRLNAAPHISTIIREGISGGGISSHLPWSNGRVFWDAGTSSGAGRLHTPSGLSSGNDAFWQLSTHHGGTDLQYIRKNGLTLASDNTTISLTGNSSTLNIGSTGSSLYYNGDLAEVIAYIGNDELQTNQRQKIESYLALKYGYTLDNTGGGTIGDYINSNDETIWDADDNATYHNEIIGISRDDASDLVQKQSNTRDNLTAIYIDNLANYNGLNTSTVTNNLSSVVIGHNQGALNDLTASTNSEKPACLLSRLEREWKATNHNFTDNFALKIACTNCNAITSSDIRLLIDDDGDFTNATIYEVPQTSITADTITIKGITNSMFPINSTKYFTIGLINNALAQTTTLNQTICQGQSYSVGNSTYSTTGNYTDILQTWQGCDSTVNLNLTVNSTQTTTLNQTICQGQSYSVGNSTYSATGNFTDVLQTWQGCDSTVNLNLTVNSTQTTTLNQTICQGQSYSVGNSTYSATGNFTDVLQTWQGCDSTVNLNLTVNSTQMTTLNQTICQGQSYSVGNSTYSATGNYTDVLQTWQGCDSTVNLNLTVNSTQTTTLNQTICQGQSYSVGNSTYSAAGNYTDVLQTWQGCDSTVHLNLMVNSTQTTTLNQTICQGQSYSVGNSTYSAAGNYTDVLQTWQGCDSTVHLNLMVNSTQMTNLNQTICQGQSYSVGNSTYSTTGNYTDILQTWQGCDSTVNLNLTVNSTQTTTLNQTICQGQSITVGNSTYSATGNYTDVLQTWQGCDSTVTLNLTVNSTQSTVIDTTICDGESVFGYSTSGNFIDTLTASTGCDSIRLLNLTVLSLPMPIINQIGDSLACSIQGQSYQWFFNNALLSDTSRIIPLLQHGTYSVIVTSQDGCNGTSPSELFTPSRTTITSIFEQLKVFPNPATQYLYLDIKLSERATQFEVLLLDGVGKQMQILSSSNIQTYFDKIDISDLPVGYYILQIIADEQIMNKKVIIE